MKCQCCATNVIAGEDFGSYDGWDCCFCVFYTVVCAGQKEKKMITFFSKSKRTTRTPRENNDKCNHPQHITVPLALAMMVFTSASALVPA